MTASECPICDGIGEVESFTDTSCDIMTCKNCKGTGMLENDENETGGIYENKTNKIQSDK